MVTHAIGAFQVASWDESTYDEPAGGGKLTRAQVAQDFTGDLEAKGTSSEFLMCYRADGTADFVGLARLAGRVGGHAGAFVMQASGTFDGAVAERLEGRSPGPAPRGLAACAGRALPVAPLEPGGTYELDWTLE